MIDSAASRAATRNGYLKAIVDNPCSQRRYALVRKRTARTSPANSQIDAR